MTLSLDGTMLATFSTVGVIRIWDLETFKSIKTLIDKDVRIIRLFVRKLYFKVECTSFYIGRKH